MLGASQGQMASPLQQRSTMVTGNQMARRSTVAAVPMNPVYMARVRKPHHLQCTHFTMTRLYTTEFRCGACLQLSSQGWLWRCTQDRELLLEDDLEKDVIEKIDALSDVFEKPSKPRKGSPAARVSKLSFLEEVSDEELKSYAPVQIQQILDQRARVLYMATRPEPGEFRPELYHYQATVDGNSSSRPNTSNESPTKSPKKLTTKPWLPPIGGECQYKCCHACRPHLEERAYLSINGIVDGDLPLTAVYGFGFNLNHKRPVSLVKHVSNLGLRPNPSTPLNLHPTSWRRPRGPYLDASARLALRTMAASLNNLGLGIFNPQAEPQARSQVIPAITPSYTVPALSSAASTSLPTLVPDALTSLLETPLSARNGSIPPAVPFPPSPILGRRASFSDILRLSIVMNIPLPEQTEEEIQTISRPSSPLTPIEEA